MGMKKPHTHKQNKTNKKATENKNQKTKQNKNNLNTACHHTTAAVMTECKKGNKEWGSITRGRELKLENLILQGL